MKKNEAKVYSDDALLVTENEVYTIAPYDDSIKEFFRGTAYLYGEYFYIYRGEIDPSDLNSNKYIEPGIYINKKTGSPILVDPDTEDDKTYYQYYDKINSYDPQKLVDAINSKEQIIKPISESSKIFLPEVSKDDDILKRLIKMAILDKGIDLDSYKYRFIDRNSLFNFKSALKNPSAKLSILLFDRGVEAMNLKYTIILEEANPDVTVGDRLSAPISVSSDDTFEI